MRYRFQRLVVAAVAVPLAAGLLVVAPNNPVLRHNQRAAEAPVQTLCTSLVRVSVHNSFELYTRHCVNQSDDLQSLRAYQGWECRLGTVRYSGCRVSLPHLKLDMNGVTKRDNNMGTYPTAPAFSAGTSWYGSWYNYGEPDIRCWPSNSIWNSQSLGGSVRYNDGFLDPAVDPRPSLTGEIGCLP